MARPELSRGPPGLTVAALGTGLELVGLGLDTALHARDPGLAARESVFTASNPGHLLFVLGLALAVAGVAMIGIDAWGPRSNPPARRRRVQLATLPLLALAVVGGGAATQGGPAGRPTHGSPSWGPLARPAHLPDGVAQLRRVQSMLTSVKAATRPYEGLRAAHRAGYVEVDMEREASGLHLVNLELLRAGRLDLRRPPFLVYDLHPNRPPELVGVAWTRPRVPGAGPPPSPFGRVAAWHKHAGKVGCLDRAGAMLRVLLIAESVCERSGGVFLARSPWIMHGWFRAGPEGPFSAFNSTIRV